MGLVWKKDSAYFEFDLRLLFNNNRLELQDRVRRLEKEPQEEEKLQVDQQRIALSAEFEVLEEYLRRSIAADGNKTVIDVPGIKKKFDDVHDDFNDLDIEVPPTTTPSADNGVPSAATSSADNISPPSINLENLKPETRSIILPSTCLAPDHPLSKLELVYRQRQAKRYIMALQNVIAEKSFQYTNIIRAAPRKSVVTRARNSVSKLNTKITFFAKIYCRSRAALERLTEDEDILQRFRILTKPDLKASGAIRDPNTPGSSTVRLSWIWQMSDADNDSPAHICECMCYFFYPYKMKFNVLLYLVQRVHWLRARAQLNRWREEKMLVGYEMQWTVRYFHHQCAMWKSRAILSPESTGASAYASRQSAMWYRRACSAEKEFIICNNNYVTFSL